MSDEVFCAMIGFKELDSQPTVIGEISLRRRKLLQLGGLEIFEVKLGDEYLMSSLFHEAEEALSTFALKTLDLAQIDVVVGGLGLGYTAVAALRDERVRSMIVVDLLAPVIEWHKKGLVPLGPTLTADSRCHLVQASFFELAASESGFDSENPGRLFDAILLDIDHSPARLLNESNGSFYGREGLRSFSKHLKPGGVFGLWSDDGPEEAFMRNLSEAFDKVDAHVVTFPNPLSGGSSTATVYLATRAPAV